MSDKEILKGSAELSFQSNSVVSGIAGVEFTANLFQDSHHPGSTMYLTATLKGLGGEVANPSVHAKVHLPDGTYGSVDFLKTGSHHYKYDYVTTVPGLYKFVVIGKGKTIYIKAQ